MDPEPTPRRSPIDSRVAHILGQSDYGNLTMLNSLRKKPILETEDVTRLKNTHFEKRLETMPLERLKALCDELYYSMDDLELERRIEKLFVNYEIFSELPDRAVFMFLAKKHANSKPSDFLEFHVREWFIKTDTNGEFIFDANGEIINDVEAFERWKEKNERNFFILLYTALTAPAIIEAKPPEEIIKDFQYDLDVRYLIACNRFIDDHPDNREESRRVSMELGRGSKNFANNYLPRVREAAIANDGTLDDVIIEGKRQHERVLHDIIEIAENRIRAPKNWLLSLFGGPGGKKRKSTRRRKQKSRRSKKAHKKY